MFRRVPSVRPNAARVHDNFFLHVHIMRGTTLMKPKFQEKTMKRFSLAIFVALVLFVIARPLHAQIDGCTDSPENPTAILGIVGVTGAGIAQLVRTIRLKSKD